MERNGRNSCTGNSRHIHIKYFFVKDRVDNHELVIQYCPTAEMLAGFFTKPLQGALFNKFRKVLIGWEHINTLKSPSENELKECVGISNDYNIVSLNSALKYENEKVVKKVKFKLTPTDGQSADDSTSIQNLNGLNSNNDEV